MANLDEQAFLEAKKKILEKKRKSGNLNELLRAKRGGDEAFLAYIYPDLKKKGFTKPVLARLGQNVASLKDPEFDNIVEIQNSDKRKDSLSVQLVVKKSDGLSPFVSDSTVTSTTNQDSSLRTPEPDADDSSEYEIIHEELHEDEEVSDNGSAPFQDSSDLDMNSEDEEPDFMNDLKSEDASQIKPLSAYFSTTPSVADDNVGVASPSMGLVGSEILANPELDKSLTPEVQEPAQEEEAVQEEETVQEKVVSEEAPEEPSMIADATLIFSQHELESANAEPQKNHQALASKLNTSTREELIEEIKQQQKKHRELQLENQNLMMKINELKNGDDTRQVDILKAKIADLNEELVQQTQQIEDLKADHEIELESLRFETAGRVRAASAVPHPDAGKIQENQARVERLEQMMYAELESKDKQIARLQAQIQAEQTDLRSRSKSVFAEEWAGRVTQNMPEDLHTTREIKDQIRLVSEFLRMYHKAANWKIETKAIGDKNVTVYTLEFGGHTIRMRFSMLMPAMMFLAQGIGINKSTYSFSSLINSGDEARKSFFADACADIYKHLHQRAETPSFEFVYQFLTSLFSSYDGVQHIAGRKIPIERVPKGTLPAEYWMNDG